MTILNPINPALDVPLGRVPGSTEVLKFGRNTDIGTAADEDIWDGGGTWVEPTTDRLHDIVSDDANDTLAGTGARTVLVQGLNSTNGLQEETITMAGASKVPTVSTYTMIYRMVVTAAGSGGENAGTITATAQTDLTVTAQINPGNNQTLMAIYQVPADKTAYLARYYFSIDKASGAATSADIRLLVRPPAGVYQIKHVLGGVQDGSSYVDHGFAYALKVEALSFIKLRASVSANSTDISAGFDFALVDD